MTDAAMIKKWHRERMLIDLDTCYDQGIVTLTSVGTLNRVAWKCDDATYKVGTPDRIWWMGHESSMNIEVAMQRYNSMVATMRSFGLNPIEIRP